MKASLSALAALLLLALGFLMGRSLDPKPVPVPAQPAAPSPAAPARPDPELEALRGELKDAQDRVALLRREIAEQDRRRQALEARIEQERKTPVPASRPRAADTGLSRRFLDFADLILTAQKQDDQTREAGQQLTLLFLKGPEARNAFLEAFRKASDRQAVMLWDIAAGTYLEGGYGGGMTRDIPGFQQTLEEELARESNPQKRQLLRSLLDRLKKPGASPESGEPAP